MSAEQTTEPGVDTGNTRDRRRQVVMRRVRLLVAATITYNVVEAVIALVAGSVGPRRRCWASGLTP